MKANDLHNFRFKNVSAGHYMVTYQTDRRGDYWRALITDMTLIDNTKNAEIAKLKDIKELLRVVKAKGAHYSITGELLC